MATNSNRDIVVVKEEPLEDLTAGITAMDNNSGSNSKGDMTTSSLEEEEGLLKSVGELHGLSNVLHVFKCRWNELQKHLDFIQTAITELEPPALEENDNSLSKEKAVAVDEQLRDTLVPEAKIDDTTDNNKPLVPNEFEDAYKSHGRFLKKSIISYLSSSGDVAKLRSDVTEAMKLSPDPHRLVLQAIGTFYLQGIRAYNKNSPMIRARQASILILEFFLLSGLCSTDKVCSNIKEECNSAAIAWRKRLIAEGGLSQTSLFDARGLLLFIGAFGIPSVFKDDELRDLIRLSNPVEISDALRQSHALQTRIIGIIQGLLKNVSNAEVIDFIFAFGLEDKFPPEEILTTLLRKSEEARKKGMKESLVLNRHEANKKNFAVLKSVQKCLKDHKIDPSKFKSKWQINEKISILEKHIADFDKQRKEENMCKRKAEAIESARVETEKRLRLQEQRTQSYSLAGGRSGHVNGFHHPSSAPMLLPDSNHGTMAARFGGGLSTASNVGLPTSSFTGVLPSSSFPGVLDDSRVGSSGLMSNTSYPSFRRPVDQRFDGKPTSVRLSNLYRPPSSTNTANISSTSSLYQFADAVVDGGGSYYPRRAHISGTVNPTPPAYHPSYRF